MIRPLEPSPLCEDDSGGAPRPAFEWQDPGPVGDETVGWARELEVAPLVTELLWRRGVRSAEEARLFLSPSLMGLHGPETLPDVDRAVELVRAAIRDGRRIAIYGDYDVDGITSTALLLELFAHLGAPAESYIPHRLREGYGMNATAVRRLAERDVGLVITVDGGSNHGEELALAHDLGMQTIVTDHHLIHGDLPVGPVVHPGRADYPSPFAGLAGVGVAYKLVWALGKDLAGGARVDDAYREFMLASLAFVALGTVADVVPLRDENRVLVTYGLQALARCDRPGVRALMEECRLGAGPITAEDVAFRLAPHLNAAGRMGRADDALRLLITRSEEEGQQLAKALASANRERKEIERRMLVECEEELESRGGPLHGAVVLARSGWHSGVAGIVASRLVDRYQRPAFVIAVDDEVARGSIRSTPDLPLDVLYQAARPSTRSIGGHACAGGVTLDPSRIDDLRSAVESAAGDGREMRRSPLRIDADLDLDRVDLPLVESLAGLEPHGQGNPVPRFRIRNVELASRPRLVGKTEEHVTLSLRQGRRPIRGIFFRGAHWALHLAQARQPFSVVCELMVNEFRGRRSAEVRVVDIDLR